jgi:hypothetical protein
VIHRLDLHFGNALHLRASGVDDLVRPSQRLGCGGHFLDDLLAFFSLMSVASLRQVDKALRAAFTASCASFESPGIDVGLKVRG